MFITHSKSLSPHSRGFFLKISSYTSDLFNKLVKNVHHRRFFAKISTTWQCGSVLFVKLCVHFVFLCQKDLKNGHSLTRKSLSTLPPENYFVFKLKVQSAKKGLSYSGAMALRCMDFWLRRQRFSLYDVF